MRKVCTCVRARVSVCLCVSGYVRASGGVCTRECACACVRTHVCVCVGVCLVLITIFFRAFICNLYVVLIVFVCVSVNMRMIVFVNEI